MKYGTATYGHAIYGPPIPSGCCCAPIVVNLTVNIKRLVLKLCPDEVER